MLFLNILLLYLILVFFLFRILDLNIFIFSFGRRMDSNYLQYVFVFEIRDSYKIVIDKFNGIFLYPICSRNKD